MFTAVLLFAECIRMSTCPISQPPKHTRSRRMLNSSLVEPGGPVGISFPHSSPPTLKGIPLVELLVILKSWSVSFIHPPILTIPHSSLPRASTSLFTKANGVDLRLCRFRHEGCWGSRYCQHPLGQECRDPLSTQVVF